MINIVAIQKFISFHIQVLCTSIILHLQKFPKVTCESKILVKLYGGLQKVSRNGPSQWCSKESPK